MNRKLCIFALLISLFELGFFISGETKSASVYEDDSTPVYANSLDVYYFCGEARAHSLTSRVRTSFE